MNNASIGTTDNGFGDVSIAIVTAVAKRRGAEPVEMPPLYEWIDPDALDALFAPTRSGGPRRGRLSFVYDGHEVVVDCGDDVEISIDGTAVSEPVAAAEPDSSDEPWTSA